MKVAGTQTRLLSRRPLTAFGKLAVATLIAAAIVSGVLAIAIGYPDNTTLIVITVALFVGAGLAATRFRWMPPLITVLSGLFLVELLRAPYVDYHLSNPKGGGFFPFVMDVLIAGCVLTAFGASIGATIENYRHKAWQAPGTPPAIVTALVATISGMLLGALLIAAVAQPSAPTGITYTNGVPTLHMSAGAFTQPAVTIPQGSKLVLMEDISVPHIIANGSWQNGTAQREAEPGAPSVENVRIAGDSVTIGPFMTAGTYHLYCVVHPGMNLTIIVQ